MPDKQGSLIKTVAITVLATIAVSLPVQALLVWRNDSVQEQKINNNSQEIKDLQGEKADRSEYEAIQKRLDSIERKLDNMDRRMDRLADRKR